VNVLKELYNKTNGSVTFPHREDHLQTSQIMATSKPSQSFFKHHIFFPSHVHYYKQPCPVKNDEDKIFFFILSIIPFVFLPPSLFPDHSNGAVGFFERHRNWPETEHINP